MGIPLRTEEVLVKLREACKLASDVLVMIEPYVKEGVTTGELDRICHDYMVNVQKVIPACLNYHGFPKATCISINEVVCHGIPSDDKKLKQGDIVNIDYVGKQDGVEFAGGTGEGQDLTLGSGRMIDGFEDGLIGTKKGDKKELNLTFPEDYSEKALAGQAVVFEVTVNAVKEKQSAVLDDAFVQSVSDFKTVDEYRASVKEDLLKQKQQSADLQIQQYVLKNVVENSKFKLNKNTLSRRYNDRIKQYEEQAKMYGTNLSGMAKANGMDVPGLQEAVYASVKDDVKNQLVILKVAELEGITLEDADRQAFAEMNGQTLEAAVEYFGQETLDEMALNQKVMKFMADNAVNEAQDADAPAEETTAAGETAAAEETTEAETTAAQ